MKKLPTVIASRGQNLAIELVGFDGGHAIPNRDAVGFYFRVRLQPHSEESRLVVLLSGTVMAIDPQAFGLRTLGSNEDAFVTFAETAIGDFLDEHGLPDLTPRGAAPATIDCFSPQLQAWRDRAPASDQAIEGYLFAHVVNAWNYGHPFWTAGPSDLLRLNAPLEALLRIVRLHDGEAWTASQETDSGITLTPTAPFLRSRIARPSNVMSEIETPQRALAELDDYSSDVRRSSHHTVINAVKRYVARMDAEPLVSVLRSVLPAVDFDTWYAAASATVGTMVGSGRLDWPANLRDRVALQAELLRRLANGRVDLVEYTYNFHYIKNNYDTNTREFITQDFEPFHRDLVRLLTAAVTPPEPRPEAPNGRDLIKVSRAIDQDDSQSSEHPKAFISYAWEGDEHKTWIRELATELRHRGIDVILDQWQVHPGDQLPEFMEQAIRESEFVLIVCTPAYKDKSEGRKGGVGYEGNVMTAELFARSNQRKFIPVLRAGNHTTALPGWLAGKLYLDLRGDGTGKDFDELVSTLRRERQAPPPLGPAPVRSLKSGTSAATSPNAKQRGPRIGNVTPAAGDKKATVPAAAERPSDPISIVGIAEDRIGRPRNDGSRGSALYPVGIRLSRRPSRLWAELFVQTWDRPPRFTTMHRPGTARVEDDLVILERTTIDEVARYHRDTLKVVVERVNELVAEAEAESARQLNEQRRLADEHDESVRRRARDIKFD